MGIRRILTDAFNNTINIRGRLFVSGGGITLGSRVKINSGKNYTQIGGDTRTILYTIGTGTIDIGEDTGISNSALIAREKITVGSHVFIGGSCKIYDNDFHSIDWKYREAVPDPDVKTKAIHIGDHVFIGAHSIVLKGVSIGNRSVVGAGSVVTKDIPEGEIWAGNPARFIRKV